MRPDERSIKALNVTRSKAKMWEYSVPEDYHIDIYEDPAKLFTLSIGILGDLAVALTNPEPDTTRVNELKKDILFTARFFDAYLQSKLNKNLDPYLLLMGSVAFYLCDIPGNASVLVNKVEEDFPDLEAAGIENLIFWLLKSNYTKDYGGSEGELSNYVDEVFDASKTFFLTGTFEDVLVEKVRHFIAKTYDVGSDRQLLFGDLAAAIISKKIENSTWNALPKYTNLAVELWRPVIEKTTFIKEFWPAQHLLGQANVLSGMSAVVQMPTSAGKTKATELVFRSAFLADRASLAVIIAPFRALCHEIHDELVSSFSGEAVSVDEMTDVMQSDFIITEFLGHKQILVVTPEKLLYALRHSPDLASHIDLIVFDEGHQFDNGTRGITYELLITSLRAMVPKEAQKILISAVISNAEDIGSWLDENFSLAEGTTLSPTIKAIGFASWASSLGQIRYVNTGNINDDDFYVPRVIESINLGTRGKEKKDRFFPVKNNGKTVALYLGFKLVAQGGVAIFCGRKDTASNICGYAVDVIERGLAVDLPIVFSDKDEVEKLHQLHCSNIGGTAAASKSSQYGIFSHHGNTPSGIRLAVEYAMRENLIKFVVCTSTLAQGVNLPIRYLIVTSVYQGQDRIKVRDFHNLIGRAGRAGMHTEGSILFADTEVYDRKFNRRQNWKWDQVQELLDPALSEPCVSNLLSIFDPIHNEAKNNYVEMEALTFANTYIEGPAKVQDFTKGIVESHEESGFTQNVVEYQINWRVDLIAAIEGFLLAHWDEKDGGLTDEDIILLSENTLAFHLADDAKKSLISELFALLGANIAAIIDDPIQRKIYGKTLYGIHDAQKIQTWVNDNIEKLLEASKEVDLLELIWEILSQYIQNKTFKKIDKPDVIPSLARAWIEGKPYYHLLTIIEDNEVKLHWGKTEKRPLKIDNIVELCDNGFAYDGTLLIGALCEFIEVKELEGADVLLVKMQRLQKQLKYGLLSLQTVILYEIGFSDRAISQDIENNIVLVGEQRSDIINSLKSQHTKALSLAEKYPAYFRRVMQEVVK